MGRKTLVYSQNSLGNIIIIVFITWMYYLELDTAALLSFVFNFAQWPLAVSQCSEPQKRSIATIIDFNLWMSSQL